MRWAAEYWRERAKAGETNDARIINTTSPSGIYGNVGQANYGAAKAGIASMTVIAAMELGRYGITVNAIAPAALTRMTENLGFGQDAPERKPKSSTATTPTTSLRLSCGSGAPSRRASPVASSTCTAATSAWPRAGSRAPSPTRTTGGDSAELGGVIPALVAKAAPTPHAGPADLMAAEEEGAALGDGGHLQGAPRPL